MKILATGNDEIIKAWVFDTLGILCTQVNLAVAVMEGNQIVGACFFHAWNGPDVELSYYGPGTLTLDVVKGIAKIAVDHLRVSRITVRTAKNNKVMNKSVHKLGFVYEGVRHHAYGDSDAIMYGLFGKNLAKLAGKVMQ